MANYHWMKKDKDKLSKIRLERKKRLGYLNLPETREKIKLAHLGKSSGMKGKHHTEKTKRKMGKSISLVVRGEKNHNWKGGLSSLGKRIRKSLEYRDWRKAVYKKDNYTCQKCKKRGIKLEPHHIKSLSFLLIIHNIKTFEEVLKCPEIWDIKNGLALCKKCHSETDNFRKVIS